MKARSRVMRGLAAVLLLGGTLLAGTPTATAVNVTPAEAAPSAELPAPDLFSATINDRGTGVALFWDPTPGDDAEFYHIYADDLLVQRLDSGGLNLLIISLSDHELTGRETYTVRGADSQGKEGPPSNGAVPGPPGTLDPVELTSATLDEDARTITLSWTLGEPLREEFAPFGLGYSIYADGVAVESAPGQTTRTFPLVDPNMLRQDLMGDETFTIIARDLSGAASPPSNGLVPTSD